MSQDFRQTQPHDQPADYMDADDDHGYTIELDSFEDEDDELELDDWYDDSMDGDHASGLASAGWGTDEDYGGGYHDHDDYI